MLVITGLTVGALLIFAEVIYIIRWMNRASNWVPPGMGDLLGDE